MVKRGCKGAIVNVSSQNSKRASLLATAYCTSKAALDMLTKMMALELGPHKVILSELYTNQKGFLNLQQ